MKNEKNNAQRSGPPVREFPWRCRECGKKQVVSSTIIYNAEVRHDGRLHQFQVPDLVIPICQSCNAKVFTEEVDDQINAALRRYLHLLTPQQIRENLARLNLSQKEIAHRLRLAEATVSRWMSETQIQSGSMDTLLRLFFAFPQVRSVLSSEQIDPNLGMVDETFSDKDSGGHLSRVSGERT